jgi:DNA-binding MarR family transcriptional regulator
VANIARAVLRLARRLRAERPHGAVSLSMLGILATLHRLGPLSAVRLAAAERLKPQSLTRILSVLERDRLIERQRAAEDRRESVIRITPKGRTTLAHDMAARRAWLAGAIARGLSIDEQRRLTDAVDPMLRLADEPFLDSAAD